MKKWTRRGWKSMFLVIFILGMTSGYDAWADEQVTCVGEASTALRQSLEDMGITFHGAVEVEAGYENMNYDDPAQKDENSSDLTLATVALGVDARVNSYVLSHVLFLYEEEPGADIQVDEAFIQIGGDDSSAFYAVFGRVYVPFGYYESHFISDPMTVDLGETRETAGVLGYANDRVDLFFGVFNGNIDETAANDDHLENYFCGITLTLPENDLAEVAFGASYISSIGDSDALADEIKTADQTIGDRVSGYSVFASLEFSERFFLEVEILGAADEFRAGELAFDDNAAFQPAVFNAEFAVMATSRLELAFRYGTSSDCGEFLPESLFGGVVNYAVFENTVVSFEVLRGVFDNDDAVTCCTGQLAVEF